jgi:ribosomal protein L3 glutamine methyltransferase
MDEAAFLILETLHLPIDQLEPWLDAKLLRDERRALASIIDQRISTRKPASYLTQSAYIQGRRFFVDERVIVPRSFIGELLCNEVLKGALPDPGSVSNILDLCTGGGSLAILAALEFPDANVVGCDVSSDALAVGRQNVKDYGLEDRVTLEKSDLFTALTGRRFDLIISNPPYVTEDAVEAFPQEYRSEPRLAHAGGVDGMDLVRRIIADAPAHLSSEGTLVVEIGQGRPVIEAEYPNLPFLWFDTEHSTGEVFAITVQGLATARRSSSNRKSRR